MRAQGEPSHGHGVQLVQENAVIPPGSGGDSAQQNHSAQHVGCCNAPILNISRQCSKIEGNPLEKTKQPPVLEGCIRGLVKKLQLEEISFTEHKDVNSELNFLGIQLKKEKTKKECKRGPLTGWQTKLERDVE